MNGTTPPPVPSNGPALPPQTPSLAIWSLVLGILSLFCFSIFAAIPAVICGHKAINKIEKSSGTLGGKGVAVTGLVFGYIGLAFAIFCLPLLSAIAIPNFVKARNTSMQNACINNLRQIYAAKQDGRWKIPNRPMRRLLKMILPLISKTI